MGSLEGDSRGVAAEGAGLSWGVGVESFLRLRGAMLFRSIG